MHGCIKVSIKMTRVKVRLIGLIMLVKICYKVELQISETFAVKVGGIDFFGPLKIPL